jgi:quercetin dioxygenase-like cupin family protein
MSILKILNENDLWENIKSQKPFVFRNSGLPEVTWKEILSLVYSDFKIGKSLGQGDKGRYDEFGFKVMRADRIEAIHSEIQELEKLFNVSQDFTVVPRAAHQLYISIATQERSYGVPHSDPENVFFWQLRGKGNWKIWSEDKQEVELDEVLQPGDILYCPPNRTHHVVAITPRAGVSIGFGELIE